MCSAVASHHSLPQLHACSPFQFERNSVATLIIAGVQRQGPNNDFYLEKPSKIFNLQSLPAGRFDIQKGRFRPDNGQWWDQFPSWEGLGCVFLTSNGVMTAQRLTSAHPLSFLLWNKGWNGTIPASPDGLPALGMAGEFNQQSFKSFLYLYLNQLTNDKFL